MWVIHLVIFMIVVLIKGGDLGPHALPPTWLVSWSLILSVHSLVHISLTVRDRINDKLND